MRSPRRAALSLFLPLLGACGEIPTDATSDDSPRYASVGSPRFLDADGRVPQIDGRMVTTFKMVGLGSDPSTQVTASADASGLWGCMTAVNGEFDLYPAPVIVSEAVSITNTFPKQNGQLIGALLMPAPTVPLQCLRQTHSVVPITSTFANVQLSHPNATTFTVDGLFDIQNYFLRFEVVPTITSAVVDQPTLVINGAFSTFTVTINNTGIVRPDANLQGYIRQGTTYRAAGGRLLLCPGVPVGTLPGGDCTFSASVIASNDPIITGNGDLVPGPAVFELHLEAGSSFRVLAGLAIPITLIN